MVKRMKKVFSMKIVVDDNLFLHFSINKMIKYHILKIATMRATYKKHLNRNRWI